MENIFEVIDALPAWFVALDALLIAVLGVAALTPTDKDDAVLARAKNLFDKLRALLVKRDA